MKYINFLILSIIINLSFLSAGEFTVSSYNAGGLSDHYDYLRAASMQKVMQERFNAEPSNMALNENMQKLALQILFASQPEEKLAAEIEWNQKGYQKVSEQLTTSPKSENSPNTVWEQKVLDTITSYQTRPVTIHDEEVSLMLNDHLGDLTKGKEGERNELLKEAREMMAKRIFAHHLKYDIICLQEADYLNPSLFPEHYEVQFSDTSHSVNGVAWNANRFELVENIGSILGRAYAVKLQDKESGKTVLVVSGHITGCNPYRIEPNPVTGASDSFKGDNELKAIIELFDETEADFKVIAMDSNVTALHPRLNLLKDANYQLDYKNFLEPTCTNPNQVLNTRIDWIAFKEEHNRSTIENIPVLGVGLNSMQTNISDHKPVAAKINF